VRWASFVLLLLVAGCGGTGQVSKHQRPAKTSASRPHVAPGFRTAFEDRPTIDRLVDSKWVVVTGPLKPRDAGAQWGPDVWLSPDRKTLLAEWFFPCDGSVAVFVPLDGGRPRVVTGESDWRKAPISRPLGWTYDGKARVQIYESWRGYKVNPRHPRIFIFNPRAPVPDAHPVPQRGC
jgi:hypothetical protein